MLWWTGQRVGDQRTGHSHVKGAEIRTSLCDWISRMDDVTLGWGSPRKGRSARERWVRLAFGCWGDLWLRGEMEGLEDLGSGQRCRLPRETGQ